MIAKKSYSIPFIIWIIAGTIIPLASIAYYGFTDRSGSFTFDNITAMFRGDHLQALGLSLSLALISTVICLLLAFPMAMVLRESKYGKQGFLIFVIILPMWMNTMLRTYAWRAFFSETGVLNTILIQTGILSDPVLFLKNEILADIITKLVMTNDFLPFMILPIYSVLIKIDGSLFEAALDLGANRVTTFGKVILPLSLPGVISGIQMVFMPSLTFYMIPDILNEGSKTTIGNTVQNFILNESSAYNQAGNVLSLLLLIFVLITMGILRGSDKEETGGGMVL